MSDEKKVKHIRATFNLPEDLVENYRNACWWERVSLSGLVEEAMAKHLAELEAKNGGPYEQRRGTIARGRAVE